MLADGLEEFVEKLYSFVFEVQRMDLFFFKEPFKIFIGVEDDRAAEFLRSLNNDILESQPI